MQNELVFSVSDFVAVFNQTISYAYPSVSIDGEVDNFRISKNRWLYFNLKDDRSSVKFFGNISQLPGPLEDGLLLRVRGVPFLHPQYGFSINVQFMQPIGKGSIKRAAQLLEIKLTAEGLFDTSRKRQLAYPPSRIGLITSVGSAAYHDFVKILSERWGNIDLRVFDVQVQGEVAPTQIVEALEYFNSHKDPVDVLVIIRGGGSIDDLAAFNTEAVTRAVATSRIPTLVAIGHEVDISLAEKAADKRGSTPTHAAEILTPDRQHVLNSLEILKSQSLVLLENQLKQHSDRIIKQAQQLDIASETYFKGLGDSLTSQARLLDILSPRSALKRGYAVLRAKNNIISSGKLLSVNDNVEIELCDADLRVLVKEIKLK